jgi:hypothetical protein
MHMYIGRLGLRSLAGGAGGAYEPGAVVLLGDELEGFTLDFLDNTYAIRTVTDQELLLLQLGDVWDGLAMDFTTNLYAIRQSVPAETLLGPGPERVEDGVGIDFTTNTYAVRI